MNLNSRPYFLGIPVSDSSASRIGAVPLSCRSGQLQRRASFRKFVCSKKQNEWNWTAQANRFSHFCGKNVEILRNAIGSQNGFYGSSVKEPLVQTKALVKLFFPSWKEGLLVVRCSVVAAILSGVCLLLWYGQSKAKGYVEKKLLPSVCLMLSEYLHREIDFGKVKSVSPFGITLEACSIGPYNEEFSCSEVPTLKLRLLPFASLRNGKIVIDAMLSHPTVLVVQKKDFTWMGLPFPSEDGPQRHLSSEEGIDYRTRTRRVAREELAASWVAERDNQAKESAVEGFILPERMTSEKESDVVKYEDNHSTSINRYKPFLLDEKIQWRDHQCMDTDLDYDMKHADLEKSFGVKLPGSGLRFWSRPDKGVGKVKFDKKNNRNLVSSLSDGTKRRVLDRSSEAAVAYFNAVPSLQSDEFLQRSESNDVMEVASPHSRDITDCEASSQKKVNHVESKNLEHPILEKIDRLILMKDSYLMTLNILKRVMSIKENMTDGKKGLQDVEAGISNHSNSSVGSDTMSDVALEGEAIYSNRDLCTVDIGQDIAHPISSGVPKSKGLSHLWTKIVDFLFLIFFSPVDSLKHKYGSKAVTELVDGLNSLPNEGAEKMLPVLLDSVHFKGGNLMLLAYGDREPREMENVNGHVKFQNHYERVYVQLSGDCMTWRTDTMSEDGGRLSADVFVDIVEQQWHANLKISNFFVPLFERILEIPISWSNGRAFGEVHMCMSPGESFPNLHGQIDVTGLSFQIYDSPSPFSNVSTSLRFRGQRIFVHNASGWFGSVPLEASGDFGIHPDEGEYHLMCQIPCVEVNALMRTFKMKPLLFPLAGSVTAVFNCQGPLDTPVFVGSGMASRKISSAISELPASAASEALLKNKEAGAIAAFDHVPISYLSANFTFNTDNCVADLYGIRASLVDGGEVRGAGNAWICPEGEIDESSMDINFSGNLLFDNIMDRYVPGYLQVMPLKLGDLTGETKLTGSLLRPRFDVKWTAPIAEGSFSDARGDIIIVHDCITVNSSSVAFDLYSKIFTTYSDHHYPVNAKKQVPFSVDGIELDLRMRGFEFFTLDSSYPFDSPRPTHLKATGKLKFQGTVTKSSNSSIKSEAPSQTNFQPLHDKDVETLAGEVLISGLKLNQLTLAPQLSGNLTISRDHIKLDATGRPDESLAVEVLGCLSQMSEENPQNGKLLSFSLQKGQLIANFCYRPMQTAVLEVRNLPLDELELASLRGIMQKAEIQLSFLKRRGHGILSVLHPKFSGVLGEALETAVRWSGDVITIEKAVLEQENSQYELQGEYVLPGTRDRSIDGKERVGLLEMAMTGHLSSVISSMGRWRMRLEVPRAEVSEMLPLARLLSRSKDPDVRSRSKDFFVQNLQAAALLPESLQHLLEVVRGYYTPSTELAPDHFNLPGLAELKGFWRGCLDASGGGNGDTMAEFDFHGEDWEWGTYKTQRVLAVGAYSNDDGLRLDRIFIQKENATVHADGTLLGPKSNLHFAVLNFPVSLVPTLVQIIESTASETVHSLRQFLSPIRGILHMEGDLRGSLVKPECDVQVRLLDGSIGGIDLGRAEVAASVTSTSRFLFNAKLEPSTQNGHVHIQGSVPINFVSSTSDDGVETETSGSAWNPSWVKERVRDSPDETADKKLSQERTEDGWNTQLAASLKVLNWNFLDVGEVRLDADIKDGGMMLLTALTPYADWLHGNADVILEVRGTVDQPVLDGFASLNRASVSSPFLRQPLTNLGGTLHIKSNRLCITNLESRVSRRGKLLVKGNLPLIAGEASPSDKIDLKCEDLEVRAKNILSGQIDTQVRVTGSILQPNISGNIKLSHGEAYLPHDKGSGATPFHRLALDELPIIGINKAGSSRYYSRVFSLEPAASGVAFPQSTVKSSEAEELDLVNSKPKVDIRLNSLKLVLGPELRIVYPLILNFAVSGEMVLNGLAHPKLIKPKGVLAFENGDVNLVATQLRLKRDHVNVAKFEPEEGLDPTLDLALVGSEWQFRIQSRASNWQEKLVVTSMHSVEQEALSPTEAARVFESQLAESILEGDGKLAFKKLAAATLETLMPRIEGKGEFGQARWRLVYAPQIPSLLSVDPTTDPLKSLANNISFGTEVEVQLGKRLQASIVRQMKDSEMAVQWTLSYQLTSRLRLLLQSAPTKRLLFEYSATSQS